MSTAPARWAWRIEGELDVAELRRTADPIPVRVVDLGHSTDIRDAVGQFAVQEARQLDTPARVCVFRLAEGEHVALITTQRPQGVRELDDMLTELLKGGAPVLRTVIATPLPWLDLPTDHPRPVERSSRAATVSARCGYGPLLDWCTAHDVELVDLLQGGLAAVLARYCGGGTVTFAADLPEGARSVRLPWSDADSPAGLVRAVSRLSASEDELPAGQVLFSYTDSTPVPLATGWTDRDMCVTVVQERDELEVRVDYDVDLFVFPSAQGFLHRLIRAWSRITEVRRLVEFTALTDEELHGVLTGWQGNELPYPDECVHDLVFAQPPDKIAVVCGGQQLTYGELTARASHTARRLRELGVGTESVVGVLADRSIDSVVGLLAVLCAGGAYVPIDPSYPDERVRYVVRDSGALLLLGTRDRLDRLPRLEPSVPVVELAGDMDPVGLAPAASPDNLAYLIYTSGSTGRPKGVAVTHRSLVLSTSARRIGGDPPTVDLVTMPLSFDGSAGGLYWTLTTGGTALLPTEEEARDPRLLARTAQSWSVTHIHSIPSHYAVLREAGGQDWLPGLRLVSVGGEPLPHTLVDGHLTDHPDALLLNDYGPTEATVWASAHICAPSDGSATVVPIGPPLPNYRAYVLDEGLRPVPPGIAGELYLGGDALARGYHGRPALTGELFLPDPFGDRPGMRLYRTGDRVRQRPDGELEILGRVDNQVKVRGFRIELGEIENTLVRHPAVGTAAVVLSRDGGAPRLTAYVTPAADSLSRDEIHAWLSGELPLYMLPDVITVLDELPRNANGKVDTRALRGGHGVPEPTGKKATVDDLAPGQVDQLLQHLLDRTRSRL
ncbi:non-ribosomal peptide synthetase [Actinosynnema sp. ALI-1.44]|uniref:non-ribosomal peptide synthetase n=1 Tax=Actinosynnema sp. ALI-1.44 TaxID=1933779 RepID=UPI001177C0B2|nr:amino acid adenylation domain-containing protein [Actinosynnema sp. ALI-1.44]